MENKNDQGIKLNDPPTDGITNVEFLDSSDFLIASSWDTNVRLYDVKNNNCISQYSHSGAVLDCSYNDNTIYSGSLDTTIKKYNIQTQTETEIGSHEKAVSCVEYSTLGNLLITGSWDKNIKLWDERIENNTNSVITIPQNNKVFALSVLKNRLIVGTAERKINIYDIRNLPTFQSSSNSLNNITIENNAECIEQSRESSLKYQTRCIQIFPDLTGYALGSVEGRVAIEYFDPSQEVQSKKYAFKCHRSKNNGIDFVFPVNCIAFHQSYGTFATGGCDHIVNIWDGKNKKRICQFVPYPTSIASLAFSNDGNLLAIASSYTFENGENETAPPDEIYIKTINDIEVKPKPRQPKNN
eukprot:TRINITY_DN13061_c0_g1_i1.p1 TRINITY_DN13061_c0_g1~~TRINITY_DN13061_c0_g1_i1.p1  ORF type:complete len:355 (-),score=109.42 TRINITY_DN13061_c0_g1_i1:103-1167(-)